MFDFIKNTAYYRKQSGKWQKKYDATAPKPGDPAPDFELADVNGQNQVHLSDFRAQKPVVLVFGSFT